MAREALFVGAHGVDDGDLARDDSGMRSLRLFAVTFWPTLMSRWRNGPRRPSWSFMFEWMVRFLRRDWDETASWPLERQREAVARKPYPKAAGVAVHDERLGGVDVRRFVPPAVQPGRVVFFHGGSYVYGSTRHSHAALCAQLAVATSREVVGVEYRLAPEHPWPAQLEDARAVCDALDGELVLAGDSAGGHLAVLTGAALQRRAQALVLLSPWSDLSMPGASFTENADFDFGTRAVLVRHAEAVRAPQKLEPFADMPRTFVSVGEAETPRDDILAFTSRLQAANVDLTVHRAKDMPHNALLFASYHPEARAAFDAAVKFITTPRPR